jgi:hypothetical protein
MGRRDVLHGDAGAAAREPPRLNAPLRLNLPTLRQSRLGRSFARDDWSRDVICMRIPPEHPFDAESAVLMLDQHFSRATGVTIVFCERDGAANGLRLAGIVSGKASPSLDDLPTEFLVHHDVSRIEHERLQLSVNPLSQFRLDARLAIK